ncbi:kinase-like protein [Thelephora ganbajun]|uniref:Kinase-like protein n=1 Tax=Thelephora ganbajun TaxID=370292 RepID=A0ACB6ZCV1_THEGA|nr:kinase-like protein [Thelephora ganbajun]
MPCEADFSGALPLLRSQRIDHLVIDSLDVQFWTNIYSMEITSNECLSEVRYLLNCPSKIALSKRFRGNDAQTFIEFLDQVLARSYLDDKLWRRGLRLLSKICKAHTIIPSSYILQEEQIHVGRVHYHGGFADVSDGKYQGCTVAIKQLRVDKGDSGKIFKRLCREIITWKHLSRPDNLSHPNILPLLGVSLSAELGSFRILTEWMPNGNIMRYARSNPAANRLRLLSEVMSSVAYLHNLKIVHGDLKGANILVDNTGTVRVADFGLMTMVDLSTVFLSGTLDFSGGTYCRMSPELLDPQRFHSNGRPTRESDCYALGMVVYEVLTGLRPFHHIFAPTPVPAVLRGERPEKPPNAESLGFSGELWGLVQSCWSESSSMRPTARELFDCIFPASLTWDPPLVYPAVVADASSVTDSDSSGSLS